MGDNIAELNTGGVIVRTIAAGRQMGFGKLTPSFAISTADRSAERDYIVLTRPEAMLVAFAILKDEQERQTLKVKAVEGLATMFGVDLDNLLV